MLAAQKGNLEITRLLCSQDGIKLNTVDKVSYTFVWICGASSSLSFFPMM